MEEQKSNNNKDLMARIIVKSWTDPEFKKRLRNDSRRVLEEEGFEFKKGEDAEVRFHFDTEETKNLVIPSAPDVMKLDKKDLLTIAAQMIAIQLELF